MQKGHGFRENLASVIDSTFVIFMFVDQLLLVNVFSELYHVTYAFTATIISLFSKNKNVGLTVINR